MNTINVNMLKVLSELYEIFKDFFYTLKSVCSCDITLVPMYFFYVSVNRIIHVQQQRKMCLFIQHVQEIVIIDIYCFQLEPNYQIFWIYFIFGSSLANFIFGSSLANFPRYILRLLDLSLHTGFALHVLCRHIVRHCRRTFPLNHVNSTICSKFVQAYPKTCHPGILGFIF